MEDDYVDPTEVDIKVLDREVTLEGTVAHRHMKHRIEDLVDSFPSVREIHNRLRVVSSG